MNKININTISYNRQNNTWIIFQILKYSNESDKSLYFKKVITNIITFTPRKKSRNIFKLLSRLFEFYNSYEI